LRGSSGVSALSTDTSDDDKGKEHHAVGDEQVHATGHLVASNNRSGHGEDLKNVGDELDEEGILDADSLGKDDTVHVEEEDTADLRTDHGTARVEELAALNRVGEETLPG
jgi:hypothetical protein